jgi:hypothetical protein
MLSAGARTQRRTRRERAWAHAKARAEWRRDVAEGIAAARATAFVAKRAGSVGAQPVASRFALRINALHGEAGQVLHIVSPQRPARFCGAGRGGADPNSPVTDECWRGFWRSGAVVSREKTTIYRGTVAAAVGTFDAAGLLKTKTSPRVVDDRGGARGVSSWKPRDGGRQWRM